ncbi:MAG: alpha/beta hydrolase family esterase [Patescibacteria group bacterium]
MRTVIIVLVLLISGGILYAFFQFFSPLSMPTGGNMQTEYAPSDESRQRVSLPFSDGITSNTFEYDSNTRNYLLKAPSELLEPATLIVVIHGYGGNARSMITSGLEQMVDEEGILLVAPEGLQSSWNAYICCGWAQKEGIDDTGFIAALINELTAEYELDRVFVTGFSNGGMMSFHTAAEYPELATAIAPVAGSIGGSSPSVPDLVVPQTSVDTTINIPAYIIHGTGDNIVPYDGSISPIDSIRFTSAPDSAQWWAEQNGCSIHRGRNGVESSKEASDTIHTFECPDGAEVLLHTIPDGSHTWSNTQDIWNFFSEYR